MADHTTADLRNFAIAGHGGVGKTILTEAILLKTKVTKRLGNPTQGTSIVDFDIEEKDRQASIYSALMHTKYAGKTLQIIDTPGYDDFYGEVCTAYAAVETALIAVAADAGIQVNTRRTWKGAGKAGIARAIVVTKMDADNARFRNVLDTVQSTFGSNCVPVTVPVGQGPSFTGIVNVLKPPADAPAEVAELAEEMAQALTDSIVESNDELMERYLEGEEISAEELMAAASTAVAQGNLVPIFCVAAEKDLGVEELLDGIAALFPSPEQGLVRKGAKPGAEGEEVERRAVTDAPFSALVFKCLYDPFVGKIGYFRILSGSLTPADGLYNVRTGKREKLTHIYRAQGEKQEEIQELLENLRTAADEPIEETGDRASMQYLDRFTCRFVREDGLWRIEDPD